MSTARRRLVYILACSHSGSTLLAMLLGGHPDVVTVGELTGARTDTPERYRCSCGALIGDCEFWCHIVAAMERDGLDYRPYRAKTDVRESEDPFIRFMLSPLHRSRGLELIRDGLLFLYPKWRSHLSAIQTRNAALVRTLLDETGAQIVVDSGKVGLRLKYLLRNPALDVKVIRLLRDGRGVTLTWTDEGSFADAADPAVRGGGFGRAEVQFGPTQRAHQVARGARVWRRSNQEAESLLAQLPRSSWQEVRYEELCTQPARTLRLIFEFLGIDPKKGEHVFRTRKQHVIGNGMRLDRDTAIRLDERWRKYLNADDLAVFERVAGDLNREYGYQ